MTRSSDTPLTEPTKVVVSVGPSPFAAFVNTHGWSSKTLNWPERAG